MANERDNSLSVERAEYANRAGDAETLDGHDSSYFAPNSSIVYIGNIYGESGAQDETIKDNWEKFPEEKPFICHIWDNNHSMATGLVYGNHLYGMVLCLSYKGLFVVQRRNGNFTSTKIL